MKVLVDDLLDWIGFQLVMLDPFGITLNSDTRFGGWCLTRAGGHVYRDRS